MTIKAVFFDFMGTCLDWHASIVTTLPASVDEKMRSDFALEWRQAYFDACQERRKAGLEYEDIDVTHHRTLNEMLEIGKYAALRRDVDEELKMKLIEAWHRQKAWPDVADAVASLKNDLGLEVVVHGNGTTRLQLDNIQSSGLKYDLLFSSEMLGSYKPAPEAYHRAFHLLKRRPEECVMVAAHAYDVRGAKAVGMRTIYIYRWTDDIYEDHGIVRAENDVYLENGMKRLVDALRGMM